MKMAVRRLERLLRIFTGPDLPASISDDSHPPVTPLPGILIPSSDQVLSEDNLSLYHVSLYPYFCPIMQIVIGNY